MPFDSRAEDVCNMTGHSFGVMAGPYPKDAVPSAGGFNDRKPVFMVLYYTILCSKCGETREIEIKHYCQAE